MFAVQVCCLASSSFASLVHEVSVIRRTPEDSADEPVAFRFPYGGVSHFACIPTYVPVELWDVRSVLSPLDTVLGS